MSLISSRMGRGGHRDDRRRRLLAEDLTGASSPDAQVISGTSSPNNQPFAHKSENYGDGDFLQVQARLTDLIPRRLIWHFLLLMGGLTAIGGLMALYLWIPEALGNPQLRPAVADLGNCGSLASWFASLLLLMAAVLSIATYSVRRHKVDDYRGHYHVWLWAAAGWFVMATDAAASLHQGFQQTMIALTGTRISGDGSIWWVVPALLLTGSIGSRLLIDMWSSRLSSIALVLAAIAYLVALVAFFHGISVPSEVSQLFLVQGAVLGGHLLLATSMGLHARYVILDAEGLLPKRLAKKKVEKKTAAKKADKKLDKIASGDVVEEDAAEIGTSDAAAAMDGEKGSSGPADDEGSGDKWVTIDPPHGGSQPVLKRLTPGQTSTAPPLGQKTAVPAGSPASGSGTDYSKLSKADRKALKKKLIDQRLQRERKAANW